MSINKICVSLMLISYPFEVADLVVDLAADLVEGSVVDSKAVSGDSMTSMDSKRSQSQPTITLSPLNHTILV